MRVGIIREQVPLGEVDAVMRALSAAGLPSAAAGPGGGASAASAAAAAAAAQGGLDDPTARLLHCAVEVGRFGGGGGGARQRL